MSKRVLVCSKSFGYGQTRENLEELFAKHRCTPVFKSLDRAWEQMGEFDGIIIGTDKAAGEFFQKASNLKVIAKYGVGTDNIDLQAARDHNVAVVSLPGINCESVAEMALGLIISLARRIVEGDRHIRSGKWSRLLGFSVFGATLGLVGTGAIGMSLARMACALNMNLIAFDPYPNEEFIKLGGHYAGFDELLRQATFVSLHVPLTRATFHLVGKRELELMSSRSFLINTSRGPVVDEKALCTALVKKQIAGAALDVFETEPPFGSQLLELENVVCTPHIAAYTHETLQRMDQACVAALAETLHHPGKR
jgi:phosphoglycerate dehydrogenase-like enzyme